MFTPADTSRLSRNPLHFLDFHGQVPHGWPVASTPWRPVLIPCGCCMAPVAARSSLLCSDRFATPHSGSPHPVPRPAPAPGFPSSPVLVSHPMFIPHRAASNPSARADWILIHLGTVLCPWRASLPSFPRPILGSPPLASGTPVPRVTWCLFVLVPRPSCRVYTPPARQQPSCAGPKDRFLRLAQVAPIGTPALAFFPLCVGCYLFSWVLLLFAPCWRSPLTTPLLCVLCCAGFCGFLCVFLLFLYPPPCMHARQCCTGRVLLRRFSRVVSSPPPPWGFRLGGCRPSQAGVLPLPHPLGALRYAPPPVECLSRFSSYCSSAALCATCCSSACHGCIFLAHTCLPAGAQSSSR